MFTFIEYPVKLTPNFTEDAPVLIHIKLCTLSLRNVSKFMIKTCPHDDFSLMFKRKPKYRFTKITGRVDLNRTSA